LCHRLAPYRDRIAHVVYEAGPTGYGLVRALRKAGLCADVIAPSKTPKESSQSSKCDRLDSRKLAMYAAKGLLHAIEVPSEQEEADRQVMRVREQLMRKRRRAMQQIRSFLLQHNIVLPPGPRAWSKAWVALVEQASLSAPLRFTLDCYLADYAHFQEQVARATKEIEALSQTDRHRAIVTAMRTTPGVGLLTAMTVRTELVRPERFDNSRQVTAMQGLAPLILSSGETRREGPLMRSGNRRLRTALIECAWRWVANDPAARRRYGQLMQNTANKKKAIAAMGRRLGIILWRISLTGEPYRPQQARDSKKNQTA
jgi:transposase